MAFLKVVFVFVLVGLASPRGLTVQYFPQEYFSPTPPFHFRCVGPYEGRPSPLTCSQRIFSFENSTEYFNVGPAPHLRSIILPIQAHRRPRSA